MSLIFEWDEGKAEENLKRHGVSFSEATTIFADPLTRSVADPHCIRTRKAGSLRWDSQDCVRPLSLCTLTEVRQFALLTPELRRHVKGEIMSEDKESNGWMLDEYDFSEAEIGKFAQQYAEGTNIVVLEPDVAKVFPNSAAVNEALRQIIQQRTS